MPAAPAEIDEHPAPHGAVSSRARHDGEILTVAEVMARYRLRDRRSARRLMDEAGGFRLGAQLYVRLDDVLALEERRKTERRRETDPATSARRQPGRSTRDLRALEPGWWRRDGDAA